MRQGHSELTGTSLSLPSVGVTDLTYKFLVHIEIVMHF